MKDIKLTYRRARYRLFTKIVRPWVPEGTVLPKWAVALRWVLFPIETAGYRISARFGFDAMTDSVVVDGYRLTSTQLYELSRRYGTKVNH